MILCRHTIDSEQMVGKLKQAATERLVSDGRHPLAAFAESPPSPWARNCWTCFLDSPADILRAIDYVNKNPTKEGHRPQLWPFVTPYNPDAR